MNVEIKSGSSSSKRQCKERDSVVGNCTLIFGVSKMSDFSLGQVDSSEGSQLESS